MPAHRRDPGTTRPDPSDPHDPRRPEGHGGRDEGSRRVPPGLRDGRRAMGLVLVTVLATSLPHPWALIALATGVAALVLGLRAVAAQVRDRRWGWAAWHLVAVTFAGYLVGFGALRAAYPEPFDAWSACSRGANTRIAQAGCDAALATRTPPWLARALGVS